MGSLIPKAPSIKQNTITAKTKTIFFFSFLNVEFQHIYMIHLSFSLQWVVPKIATNTFSFHTLLFWIWTLNYYIFCLMVIIFIYLVYLKILSPTQILQCWMVGLVHNELERMWTQVFVQYYPRICLQGLKKPTKEPVLAHRWMSWKFSRNWCHFIFKGAKSAEC